MKNISSFLKEKKAQEINVTTIIIIILAVLDMVFLIFGFTVGWSNVWPRIAGFFGAGTMTDADAKAYCDSAFLTSKEAACCMKVSVLDTATGKAVSKTCKQILGSICDALITCA